MKKFTDYSAKVYYFHGLQCLKSIIFSRTLYKKDMIFTDCFMSKEKMQTQYIHTILPIFNNYLDTIGWKILLNKDMLYIYIYIYYLTQKIILWNKTQVKYVIFFTMVEEIFEIWWPECHQMTLISHFLDDLLHHGWRKFWNLMTWMPPEHFIFTRFG